VAPQPIDLVEWIEWDNFTIPGYKDRWEGLGHAGIFFFNGNTGVTKYFEYGRYDAAGLGKVQKLSVPNVRLRDGKVVRDSLQAALQ
jgi:hypothetical protein